MVRQTMAETTRVELLAEYPTTNNELSIARHCIAAFEIDSAIRATTLSKEVPPLLSSSCLHP